MKVMWQNSKGLREEQGDDFDLYTGLGDGQGSEHEQEQVSPGEDDSGERGEGQGEGERQQPGGFDYEKFAEAQARALQPLVQSRQPQQQQRQMTDEEFDKLTKKFKPSKELVAAMFGEGATDESRLEALNQLINGVSQHTLTSAGMLINGEVTGLRQQITPLQREREQASRNSFEKKVITSYPDLGPYRSLIGQAVTAIQRSGAQPRNDAEAHTMVARFIEQHVKQYVPTFAVKRASGGAQQQQQSRQGMPRMAGMAGGGGGNGGGGGPSTPAKGKEAWRTVLGPRK